MRVRDDEGDTGKNTGVGWGATIRRKSHLTGSSAAPARIMQL